MIIIIMIIMIKIMTLGKGCLCSFKPSFLRLYTLKTYAL